MAQYFRQFYEAENLVAKDWMPEGDSVYFLANSNSRVNSTAKIFAEAFLPLANTTVNYSQALGKDDPIFSRTITRTSDEFKAQAEKEIKEFNRVKDIQDIQINLNDEFTKLENFIDFKNSKYAKENNVDTMADEKLEINLDAGIGPKIFGRIRDANIIIDGLKMQYYDAEDDSQAFSGRQLSYADWQDICKIDDVYQTMCLGTYTIAVDRSNLMLNELNQDINNANRKFTFLCGHDNTLVALLASLKVKSYKLNNAIDHTIPIGAKFVINKYKNASGEEYCSLNLVYSTVDQIRHEYDYETDNCPMCYEHEFDGLEKNGDALYKLSDFQNRINESIAQYDKYQ